MSSRVSVLVVMLGFALSGPQEAALLFVFQSCVAGEPPAFCLGRDCCCGPRGPSAACRVGPAHCDAEAPLLQTTAKGILPLDDATRFAPPDLSVPRLRPPSVRL